MAGAPRDGSTARRMAGAALLLSASVLLSRMLGFVREAVLADQIGRNAFTDAYQAAFQIPDLLNYFLVGGALSIAFIPLFTRAREQRGEEAAHRLLATVLGTLGAAVVVATIVLFVWTPPLITLQFPDFTPAQQVLTVRLTRIVLPAQIFFVVGGVIRAALMAEGRFASQAAAPLIYNLGIIVGGIVGAPTLGVEGFAWGALIGALAGPFGTAVVEARGRIPLRIRIAPGDREFLGYLAVAAPLMVGVTLVTVDEWFNRWFGARLAEGTVTTLTYARRLMQAPVALVGQGVATAALPTLAGLLADGSRDEHDDLVQRILQAGLGLSVLAGAGLAAVAAPAVGLVYVRGHFHPADAVPVTAALRILAVAVPGWVIQTIAVRPFYARGDTWRPMLLGTVIAALAVPVYLALGPIFGASGLALAGVIAISSNALATLVLARRLHGAPSLRALALSGLRALAIAAPAAMLAAWVAPQPSSGFAALVELVEAGALFAAVALPLAFWLGDPPLRAALGRLLRRVGRRGAG